MRIVFAIIALVFAFSSAVAYAQENAGLLSLRPGESVTLRFDESGGAYVVERSAAGGFTPFEQSVARDALGGAYDHAFGNVTAPIGGKRPEPVPVASGEIRLRFLRVGETEQVMLFVQNGGDQGFVYGAAMRAPGRSAEHTDVCLVRPQGVGVEHWPFLIEELQLADIRLQAWRTGDRIPCA
ncbi:MAG: hypothetical protein K2X34_03250 [Hyphomonadaceae bacterium]|nr:hypothetical protein [Hyphomonadaceae bacterium]